MNKELRLNKDTLYVSEKNHYIDMELAYVKKEELNNVIVWGIYDFQGKKMGFAGSRDAAFALVKQNEMVGKSVH